MTNWLAPVVLLAAALSASTQPKPRVDALGDPLPPRALHRFGTDRYREGTYIYQMAVSADGRRMVAVSAYRGACVWDLSTGRSRVLLDLPANETGYEWRVALSADGRMAAVFNGVLRMTVFDLEQGKAVWSARFEADSQPRTIEFIEGGKGLAVVRRDGLTLFSTADGKPLAYVDRLTTIISGHVAEDGKSAWLYAVLGDSAQVMTVALPRGETSPPRRLPEPAVDFRGEQRTTAISPDGKFIAYTVRTKDARRNAVHIRETATGNLVRELAPDFGTLQGTATASAMAFSPDSAFLATAGHPFETSVWEIATGKQVKTLQGPVDPLMSLAFQRDGKGIVGCTGPGIVHRWSWPKGKQVPMPRGYLVAPEPAVSMDGKHIALTDPTGRIDLYDAGTGAMRELVPTQHAVTGQRSVPAVRFGPRDEHVLYAHPSGSVTAFAVATGKPGRSMSFPSYLQQPADGIHVGLAASTDGGSVAVWAPARPTVHVFDVTSGKRTELVPGAAESHWGFVGGYGVDGRAIYRLVIGDGPAKIERLSAGDGRLRARAAADPSGNGRSRPYPPRAHPDGSHVLVDIPANNETELHRFDPVTLAPIDYWSVPHPYVFSPRFNGDGKLLAFFNRRTVELWDYHARQRIATFEGHRGWPNTIRFDPAGRYMVTTGAEGVAYAWDLRPPTRSKDPWAQLAAKDPTDAYAAVWALAEDPRAPTLLRQKVAPASDEITKRVAALIDRLDSDRFAEREQATRDLAGLGGEAERVMREALRRNLSTEARDRLEKIVANFKSMPSQDELRLLRAVQALELAGGKEAVGVLKHWAAGAPGAVLTEDAKLALGRIKARPSE